MTAMVKDSLTGAPAAKFETWEDIDWPQVEKQVRRLQMRIAKATRDRKFGKVKSLQWLLTHSYYGKLMAIKRVSSNTGAKTPGVDGVLWNTSKRKLTAVSHLNRRGYRPQPLRRIYIPKKNGQKRPLGIPSMQCRGQQSLHLLALEPVAETMCDPNSYGFRAKRSCADAIEQCFNIYSRKRSARYVLEGDIRSCFDEISHEWLANNIPMDKSILKKWLKCGYVDQGKLFPTMEGTPQGGIISPTLLNLTLLGLEAKVRNAMKPLDKVHMVTYADDFVISCGSREVLEKQVKPVVVEFLKERGLTLSEKKTVITDIDKGFDFLGHNVRKYKGKLLIKPSKRNVKAFLSKVRATIKQYPTCKTENLIRILNPMIIGWANYFRHVVSKKTYNYVDHQIYKALWAWARRRHPQKSSAWVWKKYFAEKNLKGVLSIYVTGKSGPKRLSLARAASTPIRRHVKIKACANPFDPEYHDYFAKRDRKVKRVVDG